MDTKFTVSMAVDCRVDITVSAGNADEAFRKASEAFSDIDLGGVSDVVDAKPVNAYNHRTEELTDY